MLPVPVSVEFDEFLSAAAQDEQLSAVGRECDGGWEARHSPSRQGC